MKKKVNISTVIIAMALIFTHLHLVMVQIADYIISDSFIASLTAAESPLFVLIVIRSPA